VAIFGCESRFKTRKKNIIFIKKNVMDKIRIGLKSLEFLRELSIIFLQEMCAKLTN